VKSRSPNSQRRAFYPIKYFLGFVFTVSNILFPTFSPLFLLLTFKFPQLDLPTLLELAQFLPTTAPNSQQLNQPLSLNNLGLPTWFMWEVEQSSQFSQLSSQPASIPTRSLTTGSLWRCVCSTHHFRGKSPLGCFPIKLNTNLFCDPIMHIMAPLQISVF
jgi:hypothetical protein